MKTDAEQRFAVERTLQRVHGVKAIALELDVQLSPQQKQSDTEIAELDEAKRIHIDVDGSTVTLRGQVHSWRDRNAIQAAVWAAQGAQSVNNELRVTP